MAKAAEHTSCNALCPMRDLAHHLFSHREQERARIAHAIHKDLGGALSVIKLEVTQLAESLAPDAETQQRRLRRAADQADAAIANLRRLITELRPSILDDLGLDAAIEWLGEEFTRRHRIPCRVRLSGETHAIDDDRAIAAFRLAQEALDNVARHARATEVMIELQVAGGNIRLLVGDNGLGLPAHPQSRRGAHGLRGGHELARSLGGELRFASAAEGGALLVAELPALEPAT